MHPDAVARVCFHFVAPISPIPRYGAEDPVAMKSLCRGTARPLRWRGGEFFKVSGAAINRDLLRELARLGYGTDEPSRTLDNLLKEPLCQDGT